MTHVRRGLQARFERLAAEQGITVEEARRAHYAYVTSRSVAARRARKEATS